MFLKQRSILPGFGLSMGFTLTYLGFLVLLPLAALVLKTFSLSWSEFWSVIAVPRTWASFRLTLGASFISALVNGIFGLLVAWVLVRYEFFGKKIVDSLVDLPFALPTSVAGISLTAAYAKNGWIGQFLETAGIKVAFTPLGIVVALTFIGLPFVVRTVEPVLQDIEVELEEAATSLGANRLQIFLRLILPHLLPALITGVALAFARAIGEYGSVVFIAGNMPMRTEIVPLLIMTKLEQYDYDGAVVIAVAMLAVSFTLLLLINGLQWVYRNRFASSARGK